ncbi:DFP-domain-containing protein [Suhomyces tanzawaensis NRRL Y-17324]|uniref:DFP-domain-containing protein n=1 Tax=Suhomyces tanzawaensis NRRL Y-17324 TaxID=984487 RepID=A0A1E4SIB8_9ASCO|nr:DFP-domain-containing protein [Suhomyces tanzawaensis NRRL Y-17324]ODV79235.1 DFP-domain-containing protein [Suhomyces tanzawaensis NRRL Y-17324]
MYHTSNPEPDTAIDRTVPEFPVAQLSDEDKYFNSYKPPSYLPRIEDEVRSFIEFHATTSGKPIALVTSGGTTVPLENNTVRFIDNFSAGTRGATSAENFLENGYAVIFLHREFSLLPYSRHYSHTTNCFLDYMTEANDKIEIKPNYAEKMLKVLRKYKDAKESRSLLLIPFTTVNQYLFTLKSVSELLHRVESKALFYLAAAVSDFFLPQSRTPQHKIQSQDGGGKLVVDLEQVPKFLSRLVENWAPSAMIISFKLETDDSILIKKAKTALQRYQHQLVIGNLLQTRKKEVVFVNSKGEEKWIRLTPEQVEENLEIESLIIPEVVQVHNQWINRK